MKGLGLIIRHRRQSGRAPCPVLVWRGMGPSQVRQPATRRTGHKYSVHDGRRHPYHSTAYARASTPARPTAGWNCRIPSFWNQRMHHTVFKSPPVHYHSALGRSPERCTGESMWYSDPECSGVSASAKTRAWARVTVVHMQKREGTVGFTAGKHVRQKCKKQTCRRYEGGKTRTVYEPMLVESSVTSGSHVMAVQVGQRSCRYGRSVMGANTASAGRADRSSLAYDAP